MSNNRQQNPILLWVIVAVCFMVIFSFWLMHIRGNVLALSSGIQDGISKTTDVVKENWDMVQDSD